VTYEINLFLCGWRGFLVGTRRAWHAHQRSRLVGFRGTTVVAAPGEQLRGVKKLTTTVEAVLTRGGLVWGFGLGGAPRGVQWGRLYPTWRPGTLSNHFYVRLRKTHLLHRLTRVFTPPPRRGRRRGTRLVLRWGRLRRGGDLPPGVVPGFQKLAPLVGLSTRGVALVVSPGGPTRVPQEGHLRGGWLRRWWGVTPGVEKTLGGKFRPPLGGGWTSDGTAAFTRVVAQGLQRRNTRVVTPRGGKLSPGVQHFGTPGGVHPHTGDHPRGVARKRHRRGWSPVGGSRFQRWPQPFPSLLLGGGASPWGTTLLNEATSCGVLLIRLEGSEATPGGVLWNQDPRSLTGVVTLVDHLWGRSFRVALLRTLWGRLSLG